MDLVIVFQLLFNNTRAHVDAVYARHFPLESDVCSVRGYRLDARAGPDNTTLFKFAFDQTLQASTHTCKSTPQVFRSCD